MMFTVLAVVVLMFAVIIAWKALRLLWETSWFVGFCRGIFALSCLGVAAIVALTAAQFYSYKQILLDHPIAHVEITQLGEQNFLVNIADLKGVEQRFELRGDQWQLDARVVKWNDVLTRLGVQPAYRLERISGRYFDIEQEFSAPRTVHSLAAIQYGIDWWQWLMKYPEYVPFIDAKYGSATYMPLKDKAVFEVSLSASGILARPKNEQAKQAVAEFE